MFNKRNDTTAANQALAIKNAAFNVIYLTPSLQTPMLPVRPFSQSMALINCNKELVLRTISEGAIPIDDISGVLPTTPTRLPALARMPLKIQPVCSLQRLPKYQGQTKGDESVPKDPVMALTNLLCTLRAIIRIKRDENTAANPLVLLKRCRWLMHGSGSLERDQTRRRRRSGRN